MRCAVLGDPIAHTLSPALHRAGYRAVGLDWTYRAVQVPSGSLARYVDGLDDSWRGLSMTMPLKREALGLSGVRLSRTAELAEAANTLVFPDRLLDNTDVLGAVAALTERGVDVDGHEVVILGGGATAASVGLAVASMGAARIRMVVRDITTASETTRVIAKTGTDLVLGTLNDAGPARLVISTIPAHAQTEKLVTRLRGSEAVFDVIYDPWPTPLAAACTGTLVSGLDLLVHQAALQFELFTGQPAPMAAMRVAGENALAERSVPEIVESEQSGE
ncbi:shikimate dehydrogenase [soil metagenome]